MKKYNLKMGSDSKRKERLQTGRLFSKLALVCGVSLIVAMTFVFDMNEGDLSFRSQKQTFIPMNTTSLANIKALAAIEIESTVNCTRILSQVSSILPTAGLKNDHLLKPIFFNSYPSTFPSSFSQQVITLLTNLPRGMKSFYASSKNRLRFCIGDTLTATCENIHPVVDMNDPNKRYNTYYSKYILALRNPMRSFPASAYGKLVAYHGLQGQMPEENWKSLIDQYLKEDLWKNWKSIITAWQESKFDLGMYFVYEDIFSKEKGPRVLQKMALLLQEAGFEVPVLKDNIEGTVDEKMYCLWSSLEKPSGGVHDYSDWDYTPGYTDDQLSFLSKAMEELKSDMNNQSNFELVEILQSYQEEIEGSMSKNAR